MTRIQSKLQRQYLNKAQIGVSQIHGLNSQNTPQNEYTENLASINVQGINTKLSQQNLQSNNLRDRLINKRKQLINVDSVKHANMMNIEMNTDPNGDSIVGVGRTVDIDGKIEKQDL